jgi:hypothetical protein
VGRVCWNSLDALTICSASRSLLLHGRRNCFQRPATKHSRPPSGRPRSSIHRLIIHEAHWACRPVCCIRQTRPSDLACRRVHSRPTDTRTCTQPGSPLLRLPLQSAARNPHAYHSIQSTADLETALGQRQRLHLRGQSLVDADPSSSFTANCTSAASRSAGGQRASSHGTPSGRSLCSRCPDRRSAERPERPLLPHACPMRAKLLRCGLTCRFVHRSAASWAQHSPLQPLQLHVSGHGRGCLSLH